MRYLVVPLLSACLLGPLSFAAEPPEADAAASAAAPKADEVPALIKQLGDDGPKAREEAGQRLRRLGQIAMPALTEAAQKSDDPEVATRAAAVARQIESDRQPQPTDPSTGALQRRMLRLGLAGARLRPIGPANVDPGKTVREVNTVDGGKRIKIREDARGLTVTTVEKTPDGAEVTRTTVVKDAATLKREFPEVYPLYEKHIAGLRPGGAVAPGELRIEPLDADGNVDVDRMLRDARRMLDEQRPMIEAQRRMADQQLREARRQLDEQMRQLREEQK